MKAGNAKDLPPGDMRIVKAGDREVLLVNTGTGIYALDNFCIHGGCRLAHGNLEGENLRCRCHGSVFRVATGEVVNGPATTPQPSIAVTIGNGEIILGL